MVTPPGVRFENNDETTVTVLDHPVTANEIHAAGIGLSGTLFGVLSVTAGSEIQVAVNGIVLLLAAYAIIGDPAFHALPHDAEEYEKTIGLKTIKCEPWWFLVPFMTTFLISRVAVINWGLA